VPPSEKVSQDDIVRAALEVVELEGLAALTARRVASQLNVSTAPVYRNFASMEELARAAMQAARDLLLEHTARVYTDRPFLNMGAGIAVFAREHPRLYRALFLESDDFEALVEGFLDQLTADMRKDPRFAQLDRAQRAALLDRMWTYTHGLASLIAVGLAKDASTESIVRSLEAVGRAVIGDALGHSK
jgi:AcrR family transcriptional regulator